MTLQLTPWRVESAFWLAVSCGLATGIGFQTDWGRQVHLPVSVERPVEEGFTAPRLVAPFELAAPDTFLETAMRPVFSVTRRPAPPPPPPEPPKPTMKKEQFVLTGVTVSASGNFAFLAEKAANRGRVVREGNEINGITVKQITATQVTLGQYDDTEVLTLKTAKGPAASPGIPARPDPRAPQPNKNPVR